MARSRQKCWQGIQACGFDGFDGCGWMHWSSEWVSGQLFISYSRWRCIAPSPYI